MENSEQRNLYREKLNRTERQLLLLCFEYLESMLLLRRGQTYHAELFSGVDLFYSSEHREKKKDWCTFRSYQLFFPQISDQRIKMTPLKHTSNEFHIYDTLDILKIVNKPII